MGPFSALNLLFQFPGNAINLLCRLQFACFLSFDVRVKVKLRIKENLATLTLMDQMVPV